MSWVQARFHIATDRTEALSDELLAHGALSVELTDADAGTAAERPVFDEPGTERGTWARYVVAVLFDASADAGTAIAAALAAAELDAEGEVTVDPVPEQDWVRATQQQFGPIRISDRLWIVPSWCDPPDAAAINIALDPGLAFGTGSHPTTWQCLRWLEANLRPGSSMLDYGCGSGVLAIAAKRLGADVVVATDIDPAALAAARENAAANGAEMQVLSPDAVPPGPYDAVVANILSSPLKVLAPLLAGFAKAGGHIVLAGILVGQAEEVAGAYASWFEMEVCSQQEGWACLCGRRRVD